MGLYRALRPGLARYRRPLAIGFCWLVLTNALGALLPWLLKEGIDALVTGDRRTLLLAVALLVAGALLRGEVRILSRLRFLHVARFLELDLRRDLFTALLRAPAPFFDRHRTGDLLSRFTNDLANVRMMAGFGVMTVINTAMIYAVTVVLLFSLSPSLAAIALLPLPLLLLVVKRLSKRMLQVSTEVQEGVALVSGAVEEAVSGQTVIRAGNGGAERCRHFAGVNADYLERNLELARLRSLILPVMTIGGPLGVLLVLAFGGMQVVQGTLTLGELVAFNAYLAQLAWPTMMLGWVLTLWQRATASMERLDALHATAPPLAEAGVPTDIPTTPPALELRALNFAYGERAVLRDLTVTIPSGSLVGIAGATGAGKSTLLRLLTGLYPLPAGMIFVDGVDLAAVDGARHRARLAVVPQEGRLFSGSLRDNLLYARPDGDGQLLVEVARRVALAGEIAHFPAGAATRVGEGGLALSGGQRQRVCLGRALARGGSLWLLDDPLSQLDAATARSVWGELLPALRGATALVATGRVSLLAACDRVLLLDGGHLVAAGSHAELLVASSLYRQLAERERLEAELEVLA